MAANDPPVIHIARAASSVPSGAVQVYQLPASQILSTQDGNDVPGAVEGMNSQTFPCNRVCEFLGDRYIARGTTGNSGDGVFKKNKITGDWEQVHSPINFQQLLSGLVVAHPDGVPTMAYQYYHIDSNADGSIAFTTDGINWTVRTTSFLISTEQPTSSGEVVVYRNSMFWAHSVEIPLVGSTRRVITSHDIELNLTTRYTLFDRLLSSGAEQSLCVHKNKLFAFGVRDNVAAADGNRYELRRLASGFGAHNDHIHVESDAGGGQYPGALARAHAAMFTDPASGQLIIIMSGGQSTGTTVATVGGAKVLRFATADIDIADANAGVDISSIVMGDLGNPTGAGGADRYLTGGSVDVLNKVWYVVVDNQTAPGTTARVFLWVAQLGTNTECWEWKGINAEMEPVAGLVGIQLNQFSLSAITAGGGQYYPRTAAVELEGVPEEVAGGTKFEFRGEGEDNAGIITFYSDAEEEAPTTVVPIIGTLTCASGLLRNLEAYYKFNDTGLDSSGNNLNLTFVGTEAYAPGIFANGYVAQGVNGNYANGQNWSALDLGNLSKPFAISAWVDVDATGSTQYIVSKRANGVSGWSLRITPFGAVAFNHNQVGGGQVVSANGSVTFSAGIQHILASSDGTTTRLYVDGVEAATIPSTNLTVSTNPLRIGTNDLDDGPVDGIIDEVAMWSRALSVKEVASLYNAGSGREAETLLTTPSIVGNTITNFTPDGGLCSVILNPIGIGEGAVGTLIANLVV